MISVNVNAEPDLKAVAINNSGKIVITLNDDESGYSHVAEVVTSDDKEIEAIVSKFKIDLETYKAKQIFVAEIQTKIEAELKK